jgi:hypothetical protein
MMKWRKLGRFFCPNNNHEWMKTHASMGVAEHIENDIFRIFFGTRDCLNRSYTGYVVINVFSPNDILEESSSPVLAPGEIGAFDDSGAMPSWILTLHNIRYLYYIGWNLGVTVPFRNSIGLAISNGEFNFNRFSKGPIVDRSMHEPHFCGSCCVLPGQDFFRMWYLSCLGWPIVNGTPRHRYHIKYAESDEGIYWRREGLVAINFDGDDEYAISRPSVLRDDDCWKMWYSYRGATYRIGYAESENGRKWVRRDGLAGLNVSPSGWDSQMVEYPYVFDHRGHRFMLYNGNDYGRTGLGLAILE